MNKYFVVILTKKFKNKFSDYYIEMYISRRAKHVYLAFNRPLASLDYEYAIIDFLQKEKDKLDCLKKSSYVFEKSPHLTHGVGWKFGYIILRNIVNQER